MRKAQCIERLKEGRKIVEYRLQFEDGSRSLVSSLQLKRQIFTKQVDVTNLTLTKDFKLILDAHSDIPTNDKRISTDVIHPDLANRFEELEEQNTGNVYEVRFPLLDGYRFRRVRCANEMDAVIEGYALILMDMCQPNMQIGFARQIVKENISPISINRTEYRHLANVQVRAQLAFADTTKFFMVVEPEIKMFMQKAEEYQREFSKM